MPVEAAEIQAHPPNTGTWSASIDWRKITTALLVFIGYYFGAKIGFALTFRPHPVSVLWPPNSILVAALLLTPPRTWWVVLLAALPAHWAAQLQSQVPPTMILCWFISNSCEAVIGAGLVRYLIGGPLHFISLRNVGVFCLSVVFVGPFLSSFLDAGFVRWNHFGQGSYWELIRIRFASNVLAALTIVPVIMTWASGGIAALRRARPRRYVEAGLLLGGLLLVSFVVLYKLGSEADLAFLFLPLPFLLWAAVRFGALGTSTVISIIAFAAIWSAAHGHGPFSAGSTEQNALSIQIFLIVLSVSLLFLAAVIDERAKGERELRESEERFRIVADAAPVLIWMADLDKRCVFFNKPWLEFTGRTIEQEIGNGWADGVHPDDLERCLEIYTAAFAARTPFIMQYRLRRHDGEYRLISDNGVPRYDAPGDSAGYISNPRGTFAGYIGSCIDITELIHKEQALRVSEARISLAAESANLALWVYDLEKDVAWLNEKGREIYGFTPDEPLCRASFRSRTHPDERDVVRAAFDDAQASPDIFEIEHRIVTPDWETRWVVVRGRYFRDEKGKVFELIGVTIDLTAQKQAALELQLHRDGMSHLSRVAVMGEMAASLAHELNQPLSAIVSNASAGQRFIDRGDVNLPELRELLADISSDGRRAGEVVRGIRGMIKKGGSVQPDVDLNELVMNVVRMVNPDVSLHSCQITVSLDPNLPAIEADPIQLQQLLLNLVMNALEAMHDTPGQVIIATKKHDGGINVSVRDHGPGISETAREQIFDQFFTTKAEGLGMGLAIARSIVESFSGTLTAENIESGGALFQFTLPAKAGALA